MTFTELVKDTRPKTTLEMMEEWADVQAQLLALEYQLEAIESEMLSRGYTV